MTERLSDEAKRMCRMCSIRNTPSGKCNLLNMTTTVQNQLADKGECTGAKVSGLTDWYPEKYGAVTGRMIRLENGDWIFEGGKFEPK